MRVFSDNGYLRRSFWILHPFDDSLPSFQIRFTGPNVETLYNSLIESFLVENDRNLINRSHVWGGNDRVPINIAEEGNLGFDLIREEPISPA